jgi:DNA-directed RNA polymerase subunit RPC12/RpoP
MLETEDIVFKYKIIECSRCGYWFVTKNNSLIYCPNCNYRNKIYWKTGRYLCKIIRYSNDKDFLEKLSEEHNRGKQVRIRI